MVHKWWSLKIAKGAVTLENENCEVQQSSRGQFGCPGIGICLKRREKKKKTHTQIAWWQRHWTTIKERENKKIKKNPK